MDVVKDLLRIKIFREEKAQRELAKARSLLQQADQQLKAAKQASRDFQKESLAREKAMYAELCTRLVLLREIESVRIDVDLMKEKAAQLQQQVQDAESLRSEAAESVEQARAVYSEAVRMREKFDELLRIVDAEKIQQFMHDEELEMEEAAASRFLIGEGGKTRQAVHEACE